MTRRDAAAGACVLLGFRRAMQGKGAGILGVGVWVFAGFSAFANYRHGWSIVAVAADAFWFFPATSMLGPGLLEIVYARALTVELRANSIP